MKRTTLKSDLFTMAIFKRTIGFMLISSIGTALANIVDALVLGVKFGEDALAAISFVIPIYMLYNMLSCALGIGGAICYAKLLGAGKAKEAIAHFNEMTWTSLGIGVLMAIVGVVFLPQIVIMLGVKPEAGGVYRMTYQYAMVLLLGAPAFFLHSLLLPFVRADDGAKTASIAFVSGSVTDICLNFVFVFGFDMGVLGAAVATLVGVLTSVAICLWYVLRCWNILSFSKCRLNLKRILSSFGTGLATSTQSAWTLVFFIIINTLLMRLGETAAVAVFDVTLNISFLALAVFTAVGETLRPMVATFVGERNPRAVKNTLRLALYWGGFLGILAIVGLWIGAEPLCRLFGLTTEIMKQYGVFAVQCYLISAVAGGICLICMDYFQAVNREKMAFFISFLRGFVLFLPVTFLCVWLFGLEKMWVMFIITEGLTLGMTLLFCLWWRKYTPLAKDTASTKTWLISDEEYALSEVLLEAEEFAETLDATPKQGIRVVMMIEEICTAILQTGFAGGSGCIQVTLLRIDGEDFELHIRDNARSFNLFAAETRLLASAEDVNEEALNSLPLLLVRKNTKSYFYRRYQGFNTLSLTIGE